MYETITFEITGISPLRMHNKRLANPLDEYTRAIKQLTDKPRKQKTEADAVEIAKLEWRGGLYLDEHLHPCIPGECVEAALKRAAVVMKKGLQDQFKAGIFCEGMFPIVHSGPKSVDALESDHAFRVVNQMKVNRSRITRTRPHFGAWSAKFVVHYNPSIVTRDIVIRAMETVGAMIGILEDRPRCGRFTAKVA